MSETALRALPSLAPPEEPVDELKAVPALRRRLRTYYAARWFVLCDVCFALIAYSITLFLRTDLAEDGLLARVRCQRPAGPCSCCWPSP